MTEEQPRVFAISDLHLPGGEDKSMDLFGLHWQDHFMKISADWAARVRGCDIVLLPGDITWAMRLEDALPDLSAIGNLPGIKIMIKGNHDFWWSSLARVRASLPEGFYAIQNDAVLLGDIVFCGSRGWNTPSEDPDNPETQKIYQRELLRLEMSLQQARRIGQDKRLIALCHFPPCSIRGEDTPVTALLEAYGAGDVVYGHLHGPSCASGFNGIKNGIRYWFTSCDCVRFRLVALDQTEA